MSLDWERIFTHAAALPGAEVSTSYGQPAVKANGYVLISPGREPDSFCLHIDRDTKAMLIETDPDTYWETPHYQGWPALLVRYASADPERVLATIERALEEAIAKRRKPARKK